MPTLKQGIKFLTIDGVRVDAKELQIRADELVSRGYGLYFDGAEIPQEKDKPKTSASDDEFLESLVNENDELKKRVSFLEEKLTELLEVKSKETSAESKEPNIENQTTALKEVEANGDKNPNAKKK